MENTLENKAKFFALYFMQEVYNNSNYPENKNTLLDWDMMSFTDKAEYLEIKPLSQISEEDAVSAANIVGWVKGKNPSEYKAWIIDFFGDRSLGDRFSLIPELPIYHSLELIDFLRSKGYALPWMGLSVEKLIEYGWIKLTVLTK